MIKGFRHKGLQQLYEKNSRKGLPAALIDKISRILARLDVASIPEHMEIPALRLHALKGELKGYWSVWLTGNWRIVFRFEGTNVTDVDLIDYH